MNKKIIFTASFLFIIAGLTIGVFSVDNSERFLSAHELKISHVGIALSNTIGTQQILQNSIPVRLGESSPRVSGSLGVSSGGGVAPTKSGFIPQFMQKTDEVVDLLNVNLQERLDANKDRELQINTYLRSLEAKQDILSQDIAALDDTRQFLGEKIRNYEAEIDTIQDGIDQAYGERDSERVVQSVRELSSVRSEYREALNQETFVRRFLFESEELYDVVTRRIETITLNKDALIKDATVYVPEKSIDYVRSLELIGDNESE